MNIIQKLLEEIQNTDTSIINWETEEFKTDNNEIEIGKANEFELKCLAYLKKRKIEHEKDHQAINDLFNVPDGDPKKMHKVFHKRKGDKNFIEALEKIQHTCKAFREEQNMVKGMLWYSIGNKFPEKHIDAIYIRDKGAIMFDGKQETLIKLTELSKHVIEDFIDKIENGQQFFQEHSFPFMNFGGPTGQA